MRGAVGVSAPISHTASTTEFLRPHRFPRPATCFERGPMPRRTAEHATIVTSPLVRCGDFFIRHHRWRTAGDALLSLLLSPPCLACGRILDSPLSGPVCGSCWSAVRILTPPFCSRCGLPVATTQSRSDGAPCACRRENDIIACSRSIGEYDGTLRTILHAFKYERCRTLAGPLARLMARHGTDVLAGADYLIPVPLHPWRRITRGFNQAEELAARLRIPVVRALRRVRLTRPQVDLPASLRHENVRDAFALGGLWRSRRHLRSRIAGSVVVLVDDVMTTGATLEACARELRSAGVLEVRALTAARAVRRRPQSQPPPHFRDSGTHRS